MAACYRRDDAVDPEIYAGAMASVLMEYPIEIVEHVMDPRTGIPRKLKWLPSIAEVSDACEAAREEQRRAAQFKAPLGRIAPPMKVNPHMWDEPKAKARHDKDYSPGDAGGYFGKLGTLSEQAKAGL